MLGQFPCDCVVFFYQSLIKDNDEDDIFPLPQIPLSKSWQLSSVSIVRFLSLPPNPPSNLPC